MGFDETAARKRFEELSGGKKDMNREVYKKALFDQAKISASDALGAAFASALVLIVDANDDKRISEDEYIRGCRFVDSALKDPENALTKEPELLFDLLDANKSGLLECNELVKAVRLTSFGKMSEDKVEDLAKAVMKQGDKSKDGKLSKEEWKETVKALFS